MQAAIQKLLTKNQVILEKAKKKLIACLKKEGGAASLEDCCKACDRSKAECKKLINTMDNVKISPHGDVILMDGL